MTKTSLSLVLAGVFAVAGAVHAQNTYDSPMQAGEASTMTSGAPNQLTNNVGYPHDASVNATVMGAAPATLTTDTTVTTTTIYPSHTVVTTYPAPASVQVGPDTVVTIPPSPLVVDRHAAAATFNVPARAGEASTMTGGAPNVSTDNARVIQQQSHLYNTPAYIAY